MPGEAYPIARTGLSAAKHSQEPEPLRPPREKAREPPPACGQRKGVRLGATGGSLASGRASGEARACGSKIRVESGASIWGEVKYAEIGFLRGKPGQTGFKLFSDNWLHIALSESSTHKG